MHFQSIPAYYYSQQHVETPLQRSCVIQVVSWGPSRHVDIAPAEASRLRTEMTIRLVVVASSDERRAMAASLGWTCVCIVYVDSVDVSGPACRACRPHIMTTEDGG